MKKAIVIGSGYSSLSAACYIAREGYDVTVYEKNETIGGRARQLKMDGFTFDMGPTFYWMPDVLEKFFADFDKSASDYYELVRLDPGYKIYFGESDAISVSADFDQIMDIFEQNESGSGKFLRRFIKDAEFNYKVAMEKVVYKPGKSPLELVSPATASRAFQFVSSLSHTVRKNIRNTKLRQILEFPVLFLGAKPSDIPAFYCFMNYADMILGTWHVKGGMFETIKGLRQLAESMGVVIQTSSPVERIVVKDSRTTGVIIEGEFHPADTVVSGADYHHSESLLEEKYRNYNDVYWHKRIMAPSALLYFVAFNKKLSHIAHHTLFFDTYFATHAEKIYDHPGWPVKPLFYTSFPTKTDDSMAPADRDAAVILIPVASGLNDTEKIREHYFLQIIDRMEKLTGQSLKEDILFYKSYSVNDFKNDYNAYKGNAYGLANIMMQTAFLKPKVENQKIRNLFYTGQLTVPGPGIPPAVISGKIAGQMAASYLRKESKT